VTAQRSATDEGVDGLLVDREHLAHDVVRGRRPELDEAVVTVLGAEPVEVARADQLLPDPGAGHAELELRPTALLPRPADTPARGLAGSGAGGMDEAAAIRASTASRG